MFASRVERSFCSDNEIDVTREYDVLVLFFSRMPPPPPLTQRRVRHAIDLLGGKYSVDMKLVFFVGKCPEIFICVPSE